MCFTGTRGSTCASVFAEVHQDMIASRRIHELGARARARCIAIDVDHVVAGAQPPNIATRYCRQFASCRDRPPLPRPGLAATRLVAAHLSERAEGDSLPHAWERVALAVLRNAFFESGRRRAVPLVVDIRTTPGG